jgi:hypothetical protein
MSDFKIIGVVDKEDVPSGNGGRNLKFEHILEKVDAIPKGKFLHIQVSRPHHVKSIKNLLQKRRPLLEFNVLTRGWESKEVLNVYIQRLK